MSTSSPRPLSVDAQTGPAALDRAAGLATRLADLEGRTITIIDQRPTVAGSAAAR